MSGVIEIALFFRAMDLILRIRSRWEFALHVGRKEDSTNEMIKTAQCLEHSGEVFQSLHPRCITSFGCCNLNGVLAS